MHDFQINLSLFPRVEGTSSKPRWRSMAHAQSSAGFSCSLAHTHTCPRGHPKLSLVANNNRTFTYSISTIATFNAKHISSDSISIHTNNAVTSTYSEI